MAIYAIQYPTYLPAMRIITSITKDVRALITTSFSNNYISGEIVRITMPYTHGHYPWGMQQINNLKGTIEVISNTQFYIDIDSTHFDDFITPISYKQLPYVVPIGEINEILLAATTNVL